LLCKATGGEWAESPLWAPSQLACISWPVEPVNVTTPLAVAPPLPGSDLGKH